MVALEEAAVLEDLLPLRQPHPNHLEVDLAAVVSEGQLRMPRLDHNLSDLEDNVTVMGHKCATWFLFKNVLLIEKKINIKSDQIRLKFVIYLFFLWSLKADDREKTLNLFLCL